MISSQIVQVYPINTNYGSGVDRSIIIRCQYLDEPAFTDDQMKALHEIVESFIMTNRQRARNKSKAEYAKKRRGKSKEERKNES